MSLNFGTALGESIAFDQVASEFDFSDDVNITGGLEVSSDIDLNNNQLIQARLENLAGAPTCDGTVPGLIYHDTISSNSFVCNGTTFVQIDNETGANSTKNFFLDIAGGIRTSMPLGSVAGGNASVLRADGAQSRSRWSFPIPHDWVAGTDIVVVMYWSPSDGAAGTVRWEFDHGAHAAGEVVDALDFTEIILDQATPGTTLELVSSGTTFTIPGAGLAAGDVVSIQINRPANNAADTYGPEVNIHLMRVDYTGASD